MIEGYREFQSRSVRIFISSTFQDMDTERNLLVEDVFPRLRARFAPQGISINEVDLRWGIPKSLANDHRTLRICIEEIENCQPFFMGILGKREGYHPTDDEIEMLDGHLRELIDLEGSHGVSITEMEISAGLNVSTPATASFHVRGEDAAGNSRLESFEQRMVSMGYPCKRYDSLPDFSDQVVEAVSSMIIARFGEEMLSGVDETYRAHLARLVSERAGVVPSEQVLDMVKQALCGTDIHIRANEGMGKTAALAFLTVELGHMLGHHVFFHFSVDGEMGSSERLWRRLLGFFGGDATGSGEIGVDDIGVWLRKHPLDRLTFVVVDDAARFAGHQDVRARLLSLSEMDENLVVICASDTSPHTWRGASVELEPLTQQQVRMIAYQYFHRYGKTIEDEYLKLLCSNETLRNPLFLKCLLNEQRTALSFDGFEAAFRRLSSLCGFDELIGSIGMRLSDQLHDLGVGDSSVWFAMRVLASVKGGLYEEEILSCSGILPLTWSLVRAAFQPVLREYDGLWSVANSVIRDAFAATSLHHLPGIDGVAHERLVGLFSSQGVTARSTDELAYQHLVIGDEDALLELLGSSSCIAVLAAERRESLVAYLTKVQGRSDELAAPIAGGLEDAFPSPEAFGSMLLALNDAGCYRAVAKLSSLLKPKMPLPEGCDLALVMNEARAEYKMGAAHYSDAAILYDEASRLAAEFDRDTMLPLLAEILFKRAIVEKSSGYPDRARRSYEDAVGIYRTLGIEDGNASWAMGNLASLLYLFGEDERSRKLFDEAVRLRIRAFGERSPEVAWTYCYFFQLAFSTGQLGLADAISQDALQIYADSFGEESPQYAWAEINRGNWLVAAGDLAGARALLLDSIEKNDRFMGERTASGHSTYSLTSVGNLAVIDWLSEPGAGALDRFGEVWDETRRVHGEQHPYSCNALVNAILASGRDEAKRSLPRVLETLKGELGEDAPDIRFVRWALEAAREGEKEPIDCIAGQVYLARSNGAQLVIVPEWMQSDIG